VVPGILTGVVNSNLTCSKGGEFGTVLNTDIFMAVWREVIKDGLYLQTSWTVKVDPDCVFFPARLRRVLSVHAEAPQGVYLNNCWRGMHGPLEVFSRNAVKAWADGSKRCVRFFTKKCSGTCQWGEDMFVDQCLWKVLKVRRDNVYDVLIEDHCDAPKGWRDCKQSAISAFHPFKSKRDYVRCLVNADPAAADAIKAAGAASTAEETASSQTETDDSAPASVLPQQFAATSNGDAESVSVPAPAAAAVSARAIVAGGATAAQAGAAAAAPVNMPQTAANPLASDEAPQGMTVASATGVMTLRTEPTAAPVAIPSAAPVVEQAMVTGPEASSLAPAMLPAVEQGIVTGTRTPSSAPLAAEQSVPMSAMPPT